MHRRALDVLVVTLCLSGSAVAQNLDVDGGTVHLIGPQSFANVTIESGATLIMDGQLNVDGGLTVLLGGTLTQSPGGQVLTLNVPNGTVNVEAQGQITLAGTGLLGGSEPGNSGCAGQAINPQTKLVVAGSTSSSGGSFGGKGGGSSPNALYGSQADVQYPGSGGSCGGPPGGNGGGGLKILANALQVDGLIRVDGAGGLGGCCGATGGGSGGSIFASVASFGGAGALTANGALGGNGGPTGGGGRIEISYASSSFNGTFEAISGGPDSAGGSVDVHDQAANQNVVVQDGTYHLSSGTTVNSVTLLGGSTLSIDGNATITQALTIPSGTTVILNSASALSGVTLPSHVDGTLIFAVAGLTWSGSNSTSGNVWVQANTALGTLEVMTGGTLTLDATATLSGNLTVDSGGTVTHSVPSSPSNLPQPALVVSGTVLVSSGGAVDVTGKGLWGGSQPGNPYGCAGGTLDPVLLTPIAGVAGSTGGSFGGAGAGAANGNLYGTQTDMEFLGSGGGCGGPGGGSGGGLIRISAPTVEVDGLLRADGAGGNGGCCGATGGGSGGGIYVSTTTFKGAGVVSATGGVGGNGGEAGGGGRIFITYSQTQYTGTLRALPGAPGAGSGSVVVTNTAANPDLVLAGGYYHLVSGQSVNSVTLGPDGILYADGNGTITQPLSIPASATLWLNDTATPQSLILPTQVSGTVLLNAPGLNWPGQHVSTGNIWVIAPATLGPVEVRAGALLTVDSTLTVDGGITVDSAGTVTWDPLESTCRHASLSIL